MSDADPSKQLPERFAPRILAAMEAVRDETRKQSAILESMCAALLQRCEEDGREHRKTRAMIKRSLDDLHEDVVDAMVINEEPRPKKQPRMSPAVSKNEDAEDADELGHMSPMTRYALRE